VSARFQIVDVRGSGQPGPARTDVADYLGRLHDRFGNAIHAETRIFTCRAWRRPAEVAPYELRWGELTLAGERLLGLFGWGVDRKLAAAVEAELARGEAVRLFVFNSDSDLCFEEVLAPAGP
jgi:hypothetical protein